MIFTDNVSNVPHLYEQYFCSVCKDAQQTSSPYSEITRPCFNCIDKKKIIEKVYYRSVGKYSILWKAYVDLVVGYRKILINV